MGIIVAVGDGVGTRLVVGREVVVGAAVGCRTSSKQILKPLEVPDESLVNVMTDDCVTRTPCGPSSPQYVVPSMVRASKPQTL